MSLWTKMLKAVGVAPVAELRQAYVAGRRAMVREFAGAGVNRLTADWISAATSIQKEIRGSIVTLRERARELQKNNPLVERWINLITANIVGPQGFTLQMDVRELVEDAKTGKVKRVPDKVANARIEEAWNEWTKQEHCSINGRLSFRQICRLLVTYKKRDGEALLYKVYNRSTFGMQLHVISPESLDETKNEVLSDGRVIVMGVEMDRWRRPINYYFKKLDAYLELFGTQSYAAEHIVIPAHKIIHWFKPQFENQTRGVTELASSMLLLKHLSGYDEATIVNARASAAKGVYFETKIDQPSEYEGDDKDTEGNVVSTMEPGAAEQLPPGLIPHLLDPNYPADQYGDYQASIQKKLSAGMGVAYASLSNDLSQGSYGSNRVGLLDERSQWQMEQQDFIDNVLRPLFESWLEVAVNRVINLPAEKFEKFNRPVFVGRTWDWIDPTNDVTSKALELAMGMNSPWRIAGERGLDPEELLDELAEWYARAKEKGVPLAFGNISLNINAGAPSNDSNSSKSNGRTIGIHM